MANGLDLTIVLKGDAANFSAAVDQVQRGLNRATGSSQQFGHTTVSQVQAASATIRELNGDILNNVRAVERFITTIPGAGKALQAIFPIAGGLAFGAMLGEMVVKFADFIKKANEAPRAINNAFRELVNSGQLANDELRKTNDQLANQIARLEGRHENTLAIALDDARIAADKLEQSLEQDLQKVKQLLEANKITTLQAFFTGQGGTADVAGSVNYWQQQLADKGHAYNLAVHAAGGRTDTPEVQAAMAALDARRQDALTWIAGQISGRSGDHQTYYGDQAGNLGILQNYQSILNEQVDREQLEADNGKKVKQEQALSDARAFTAEQKRLAAEQIAAWRQQLDELKAAQDMTLSQEADFWIARAAMTKGNAATYKAALDEANKDIARVRAENMRLTEQFNRTADLTGISLEATDRSKDEQTFEAGQGRSTAEYLRNLNQGTQLEKTNADAIAEASLELEVASGRMDKYQAAVARATLDTQRFNEQMQALEDALDPEKNPLLDAMTPLDRKAYTSGIQNKIDALQGAYSVQSMRNDYGIYSETAAGGFEAALNDFVNASQDAAAAMKEITSNTLRQVNDQIVNAMMGKRTNFTQVGSDLFRSIASHSLQTAEGTVLSALGFGGTAKPDGSSGRPFFVKLASALGGGAGGGLFGGMGAGSDSLSGGGGFFSTILHALFQGAFADGGDVVAGRPALVGELGPELFMPASSGRIVPNSALGGDSHVWHIDARGSQDPRQTVAALDYYMRQNAPRLSAMTIAAAQEQKLRRPPSAR